MSAPSVTHSSSPASNVHSQTILYQYPVCSGTVPVPRWAHAAAAVGSFLYVYGGVGPAVLDDLVVLDAELLVWRSLSPTAARIKDRPDKIHAAAMCAMGSTLWLFGGQQGRKHLRGLHSLNTEMLSWKLVTPAGACPPGREGHSFTSVDGQVAFLFGGQGKKLYNDLYILKQNGVEWVELKPQGKPPAARSGHSMVWDGKDSLFCFGGTTSSGSDNSLSLYSISRNEWCQPECSGIIPSPRTHHSTVLLAPNKLLVFGGCNAQGVFFNDAYVLDTDNMQWSRTQPLNTSPPPRYHHSCHVVGNKVALYGGINPKQAFDTVVLLETNFGSDLSAVAEELARMTGCPSPAAAAAAAGGLLSRSSSSATSAAGLAACGATVPAVVGDLMKLQLRDLLVKRNMEELQVSAQQKAEALMGQLKLVQADKLALQKEVLQQKLMTSEAEEVNQRLQQQLAEVQRGLQREQAEHAATSAALSDVQERFQCREQQLSEARQLLDSMSAELGILSSRFHRLQQERDALKAARRQQQRQLSAAAASGASSPAAQQDQSHHHQQQQQQQSPATLCQLSSAEESPMPLLGAAAAAALLQQRQALPDNLSILAAHDTRPSQTTPLAGSSSGCDNGQPSVDCTAGPADDLSRLDLPPRTAVSDATPEQLHGLLDPSVDLPLPMCPHGQLEAACLLCMCRRFLAATAGSCGHWPVGTPAGGLPAAAGCSSSSEAGPVCVESGVSSLEPGGELLGRPVSGPSAAGLATVAVAACAQEASQYKQFLSISELARNRLEAENAFLQQQVEELQSSTLDQQHQLRVLQGQPTALAACSIEELTALEGKLEACTKAVRQVVLQRSIAESQRQANADSLRCAVCLEAPRRLAFNCGHQTCDGCGNKMMDCPFCRQTITAKIRLFE